MIRLSVIARHEAIQLIVNNFWIALLRTSQLLAMTEQAKDKQRTAKISENQRTKISGQKSAKICENLRKSAKICGQKSTDKKRVNQYSKSC
jgi:hypothetical protein